MRQDYAPMYNTKQEKTLSEKFFDVMNFLLGVFGMMVVLTAVGLANSGEIKGTTVYAAVVFGLVGAYNIWRLFTKGS